MHAALPSCAGDVLWQTELDAGTSGAPMTYLHEGKQYIAVAISDNQHEGEVIALALP
jgi:glucose dehydrogenase